jgi:hypothetical protein
MQPAKRLPTQPTFLKLMFLRIKYGGQVELRNYN